MSVRLISISLAMVACQQPEDLPAMAASDCPTGEHALEVTAGIALPLGLACFPTRPYYSIGLPVPLPDDPNSLSWEIEVTADEGGDVLVDAMGFEIIADDLHMSNWVIDHLFQDQSRTAAVLDDGTDLPIGTWGAFVICLIDEQALRDCRYQFQLHPAMELEESLFTVPVETPRRVTITMDIMDIPIGSGDTLQIVLNDDQAWRPTDADWWTITTLPELPLPGTNYFFE